jgi:hypothetical protein
MLALGIGPSTAVFAVLAARFRRLAEGSPRSPVADRARPYRRAPQTLGAMQAMMQMKKLDIAELERAAQS